MTGAAPVGAMGDEAASDRTGSGTTEEVTSGYVRSPSDLLRLLVFGSITAIAVTLTAAFQSEVLAAEERIIEAFTVLTPTVERVIEGLIVWLSMITGLALIVIPLRRKRYRLFGYSITASAVAYFAMAATLALLDRPESEVLIGELDDRAGVTTLNDATLQSFAQLTAVFIVFGPFVTRPWRRAGAIALAVTILLRFAVVAHLPADLIITVPLGATVGAAVLLAFGRPNRRPTMAALTTALADNGLIVDRLHEASIDSHATVLVGTDRDGRGLFVKVLGLGDRAADLLYRGYRYVKLRDAGDLRPFSSLRRGAEHEAFVALYAAGAGARVSAVRAVALVGSDAVAIAADEIDGRPLSALAEEEITEELLTEVWHQLALLRSRRIAHRDLVRQNIVVDRDGLPWLTDFDFAELSVPERLLDADVAQLLASTALAAGAQRSVDAAIAVVGPDVLGRALPRLQPSALGTDTRGALKQRAGLLDELQSAVADACDIDEVRFERIERINRRTLLTAVFLAIATYLLIPQFTDLPGVFARIETANWAWFPLLLLLTLVNYVGLTIAMLGCVPDRLAVLPTFGAQVATSFANKLAPAGVGSLALNVRLVQKQGVDHAIAASGVGLNAVVAVATHLSLVAVFVVWAGQNAFGSIDLPNLTALAVGLGVVGALAAIALVLPYTRRVILDRLVPIVRRSLSGLGDVLTSPAKLAELFGGSLMVTMANLVALFIATQAFGGGLSFAAVGAVYVVGLTVATFAPTPGGLGAIEAALIAGLVAAGMSNDIAVPSVFLFRFATFWIPILPGWLTFVWLQRRQYI